MPIYMFQAGTAIPAPANHMKTCPPSLALLILPIIGLTPP